jgi:RimJ/RimL family protein N-acetyltransferase
MIYTMPVLDPLDLQVVRMIRNELKDFMTNHRAHITPEQQIKWFKNLSDKDALLLWVDEHDAPIGYTFVTLKDGIYYGTLAVLPEFHNQGYGTEMYKHMVSSVAPDKLHIEIFADNTPSLVAALKSGFTIVSATDKLVTLVST